MPDRVSFTNESVLMKWMKLEIGRMNQGTVSERKVLYLLLKEKTPSTMIRAGTAYYFDTAALQRFGNHIPEQVQRKLAVPISFFFDIDVRNSYALNDTVAVEAFQWLGELSPLRELRNGRLWVAKPIVYALIRKYPSLVQIVVG